MFLVLHESRWTSSPPDPDRDELAAAALILLQARSKLAVFLSVGRSPVGLFFFFETLDSGMKHASVFRVGDCKFLMAHSVVMLPCVHLRTQRIGARECPLIHRRACNAMLRRDSGMLPWKRSISGQLPSAIVHGGVAPFSIGVGEILCLKRSSARSFCFGTLSDAESLASLNWVHIADQVLLMTSILFAYMAGVIPCKGSFGTCHDNSIKQEPVVGSSTSNGRSAESGYTTDSSDYWDGIKVKLLDTSNAIQYNGVADGLDDKDIDSKNKGRNHPFSLLAIAQVPRLQLLLATLQHLQKEVNAIPQICEVDWLGTILEVVRQSVEPICINWLKEAVLLENESSDAKLLTRISQKLKGGDAVLQDIERSGKAILYADMLFFLKFGSLRAGYTADTKLLIQHTVDIMEDFVITVADAIANIYLELISVDSSMYTEMNGFGSSLCSLSTRALQKLRNEVTLNRWIQRNFESVISMYEDRFDLFVFCKEQVEDPLMNQNENPNWWKKFSFRKSTTSLPLYLVRISPFSLSVKRTKELRSLIGWRYYFSLFLEFSDIMMPFIRAVFVKVSNAISFFLVCLIGRSLGLIYTGIRQSLGWR